MLPVIVLTDTLKIKRIKLLLYGLETIQKIQEKFPTNNYIKKFQKLQMV